MKTTKYVITAMGIILFTGAGRYVNAQATVSIDFLKILQSSGPYDNSQQKNFPDFTYMSPRDPHLSALRKKYNLDSVAGNGNDSSRVINLLHWMHQEVPHEDVINLPILNADNIISTYKQKHTGQGCFPLSVSLNEIYLSMGFKSRSVIFFSQSFENTSGGHVIDAVYLPSLKKWVWMDPEYNAFLTDEKGKMLSIPEVRKRLIDGEKIILDAGAGYHGKPVTINEYIFDFMVKYFYRYECPVNSEYDSQTESPAKVLTYIELLPAGSGAPPAGKFETRDTKTYRVKTYHTNNEELFWQSLQQE